MDRIQQKVFLLLQEIDEICKKNKITYYLSPELTLCAVTGQPFPQSPFSGKVLMPVADMEKFRKIVEEENRSGRFVESMVNNKRFPGFYLRYENTDTLCYSLNEGTNFRYPGLGVDILPIRKHILSGRKRLFLRVMESGWRRSCYFYNNTLKIKTQICKYIICVMSVIGRRRLGRIFYQKFCRDFNPSGADIYSVRLNIRRKLTRFMPEIFEKVKKISLENYMFAVPEMTDLYLQSVYGTDYLNYKIKDYSLPISLTVSSNVGCKDFFQTVGDQKHLIRTRRIKYVQDCVARRNKKYFSKCWKYVGVCALKRELADYFQKKESYIINLYKDEDYVRLKEVFEPYTRVLKKCLKYKEVYAPNKKLFEIYLRVLEKNQSKKLLLRIRRYRGR